MASVWSVECAAQVTICTVAPASGAVLPSHLTPTTVPVILPQVVGGVAFIVTPTGRNWYGVFVRNVNRAWYVPGWLTAATEASSVTVTLAVAPGASVNLFGVADSHATSVGGPHWSKPGSTSDFGLALKPPVEPPIL